MFQQFLCFIINCICCFLYRKEFKKFVSVHDLEKVQKQKLLRILKENNRTEYGKKYGFQKLHEVEEYQKNVPITVYEDYLEDMEKIKNGECNVLTSWPVLILEKTSGSTSPSKLIPYTKALKEEFQCGIKPWIYDLYSSYKGIKWGKSYWSITPATMEKEYSKGGIPIGFEDDREYLGGLERRLFDQIFAVPGDVAKEKDMNKFYYRTSYHLLKCKNLTLISVWNPTFLILLIEFIETNIIKLVDDISKTSKKRGTEVGLFIQKKDYINLWPHLKVISCWCDGNARNYSENLKLYFPNVIIQAKGLLATEGFISVPFANEDGARLAINSHFFEFLSTTDSKIYLAHELIKGKEYVVIITTSGGLYRYNLNDIVQVTSFEGNVPLVKFKGKYDTVSDLFGEKLNENFLIKLIKSLEFQSGFYMFAPQIDRYVLYVKTDKDPKNMNEYLNIDEQLRGNFHYDYCRKLGQLKELKIFSCSGNPEKEYLDECVKRGQRLGDIKPAILHLQGDWDKVFKGDYI